MINGNIEGVKNSFLSELEGIYDIKVPKDSVCTKEIMDIIVRISAHIEREISVGIDRKGKIISVAIGDSTSVEVPIIDISEKKLSGVRIIHTHPNGNSTLSSLDISALIKLKLDLIMAIGIEDDKMKDVSIGFCMVENNKLIAEEHGNLSFDKVMSLNTLDKINHIEQLIKQNEVEEDISEKAILVGADTEESLEELSELASACNIPVLQKVFQKRNKIDPAFFIGRGKVLEIAMLRQTHRANVIIFDDELSGSQVRNLEQAIGAKVIDRTTLILEIFATRAKTRESKIQVELAQLKYRSSRLMGLGTVLSRTGGGIGTRGPGEKKLETDRRHIKERIYDLSDELKKIKKIRETQREKRNKESLPQIALVGYTNAGKSTLRNKICDFSSSRDLQGKEKVFEANMLFATLDTTTRAINLLDNRVATLTDTVGFVRKLPHELVEAFKSTLEEVIFADLLCHVVDASSPYAMEQISAVEEVLKELGVTDKPILLILNKIDAADEANLEKLRLENANYKVVEISAREGINLDGLLNTISNNLPYTLKTVELLIPYSDQQVVAFMHRNAKVLEEEYRDMGTYIKADVDDEIYNKCNNFIL
ncbi:GTP-binding protein HflX [Clostridium cavendishii DSM 21758]|uniref:GTPase HflX n=1 Tax=Clostridium cavendishii DSM 21758 TaxID=1121302 RepID=A0A1M6AFD3_9CLOT|nr:GTPase HflX [Clostridium cavendishii]SHI35121.1 GTP-binding protein HflX [Clostridium cavendishii DSM 21758]